MTVHGGAVAPALPLALADIAIEGGAGDRWAALSGEARAAVLERGFVVVPRAAPSARFGRTYAALGDAAVPYVVTLDTLFWVAHVARDRALAAAEESTLGPALDTLLARLEARLATDARNAPGDLVSPLALARGVVAVGRALLSPTYHPPVELARAVAEETRRIGAHEGPATSPLLGVTVDYSQIVPRGAADASAARAAYARAAARLGAAPFALAARREDEGAELSVGQARTHLRAALLIARLVDSAVDPEAANAWHQWAALTDLAGGPSDDLTLRALLDAAAKARIDVRDPRALIDIVKVEGLRHALFADHPARLYDGAVVAGAIVAKADKADRPDAAPRDFLRAATSVRLFASRGAADAELLQALVFPSVGRLAPPATTTADSAPDASAPPPRSERDGIRALPLALDVGAWLGASDARALLHETHDDAYERYAQTLEDLSARRAAESARHDSIYASSLDALATYLAPSGADESQPGASSRAWHRHRLESALAGWTTLRHDALAFARFPLATTPAPPSPHAPPPETLSAFVEPHPEAIAKLLSLVRQTTRGLRALGHVGPGSPADPVLDSAEHLLADAFAIASREADDEPLSLTERDALLAFPSRLAALEDALAPSRAADASLAVDVHTDLVSGVALVEACGDLDDLYVVVRAPRSGRLVLAVGAAASHYEVTEPARERPTDTTWRARLHGTPPPARDEYTRVFMAPAQDPEILDASVTD